MPRPKCPPIAADIITEIGDKVVLIERRNFPLGWAIPGGFVDFGETVENAAMREAREEISLEVELRALLDLERDFLARLAHRRILDRLAEIDEAAGNRPAQWKITPFDQNDFVANLCDYVGGYRRTFRPWHDAILTWR